MNKNIDVYDLILDNIHKIIIPEELIKIELSVSRFELLALMLADRYENITMSSLAQGMSVPMSTATGIIDRMVRKKLLTRDRSEEDRRIVTVLLTEEGRNLIEDVKRHFIYMVDRVRELLTGEEFETGMGLIRKVIEGFREARTEQDLSPSQDRRVIEIE